MFLFSVMSNWFLNFSAAASCTLPKSQFGFPTWYKYMPGQKDPVTRKCQLVMDFDVNKVSSVTGIGLAIIEIMLVVAGMVVVGYIIYGAFRYLLSQGNPENTKIAKDSILNALIGLVIAILATTLVRFLATKLAS